MNLEILISGYCKTCFAIAGLQTTLILSQMLVQSYTRVIREGKKLSATTIISHIISDFMLFIPSDYYPCLCGSN